MIGFRTAILQRATFYYLALSRVLKMAKREKNKNFYGGFSFFSYFCNINATTVY